MMTIELSFAPGQAGRIKMAQQKLAELGRLMDQNRQAYALLGVHEEKMQEIFSMMRMIEAMKLANAASAQEDEGREK